MLRCVRMWTDLSGNSTFEEGELSLPDGPEGDAIGPTLPAISLSLRETRAQNALTWHVAPTRQFVLTLAGTLEFETRTGATFIIRPGDILLAEDTNGSGHRWRVIGDEPWRRAYVILPAGLHTNFRPLHESSVGQAVAE